MVWIIRKVISIILNWKCNFPDPSCPYVSWIFGWLVGWSVCLSWFPNWEEKLHFHAPIGALVQLLENIGDVTTILTLERQGIRVEYLKSLNHLSCAIPSSGASHCYQIFFAFFKTRKMIYNLFVCLDFIMNNLYIKYKIRKDRRSKFRNLIPDLDWNLLDFVVWQTCAHRKYIVIGLSNSSLINTEISASALYN